MSIFRIVGLSVFPDTSSGCNAQDAVNNFVTLRIKKRHEQIVIDSIVGNMIHVHVDGENARAYCERYIARLPRDSHSKCEAKHAQRALERVGANASIEDWEKNLAFVRSLCINCNPELKKQHHSWKVAEKSVIAEKVTFRKTKVYYNTGNTNFAISEFSNRSRNPLRKVRL